MGRVPVAVGSESSKPADSLRHLDRDRIQASADVPARCDGERLGGRMSQTFGGGYRGGIKQTCRECNRTIYIVEIDGKRVATDPDLISVVPLGQTLRLQARRVHAEQCLRYQSEAAKIKALAAAKRNKAL